jgi:hypothetical protein
MKKMTKSIFIVILLTLGLGLFFTITKVDTRGFSIKQKKEICYHLLYALEEDISDVEPKEIFGKNLENTGMFIFAKSQNSPRKFLVVNSKNLYENSPVINLFSFNLDFSSLVSKESQALLEEENTISSIELKNDSTLQITSRNSQMKEVVIIPEL